MEGNRDQYFIRRKLGSPVGPFTEVVVATMLKKGTLDGSEEISVDRRTWRPVRELTRPPAPEADPGFASEGTEVLARAPNGAVAISAFAPPGGDASGGHGFDSRPHGNGSAPRNAHAAMDLGPPDAAPLELEADDLIAVELAPLELAAPREPSGRAPAREAGAPVSMLLSDEDTMSMAHEEAPGSMPLLPTIRTEPATGGEADGGFGAPGKDAGTRPNTVAGQIAARQRTMSAVRQRPVAEAAKPTAKKKFAIVGGVAAIVSGGSIGFLALGGQSLFFGEPKVDVVLGPVAAEIERDRFGAYEEGARRLTDAAGSRPKAVRLRAAAAELLASSVVLRRGDRARVHKAEAILAEIPGASGPEPALARARAWIALAKGNIKEARRQAAEAPAGDAASALLEGWIQLSDGKAAAAVKTFAAGAGQAPAQVALRYGLGRAEEEAGQGAAAVETQKAVLGQAPSHFGAALAIARAGDFPPSVRRAQAESLTAKAGGDKTGGEASRTELADANVLAGRAARLLGKTDEADAAYRKALAIDAGDPVALVAAGEGLLEQGKMKEAIAKFEAAAPNAPAAPVAAPMKDLRFAMAAVLIEKGNAKQGLALLEPAAASPPAKAAVDPRALFWRARAAELASPPDTVAARQGYEETLKADPRFLPATLQLAALLVQQRKGAEGLAVLRRAEAGGAPAEALQLALGQAFLASGDVERATKTFKDVLAGNPKLAVARLGLASALEAGGNRSAAKSGLEALLAEAPETPGLRQHLAELLVAQGDQSGREQGLAMYRAEIATGKAPPALKMAAAKLAFDSGQTDAREIAEKLVADAPETPGALLLLARIRRAAGDLRGAVTELRRALAFESTPELHFEYARALLETGNPDEAQAELAQAPTLPQAMVERARIALRRGDVEGAVGPLEAAVKLGPASADGWLLLGNTYDRLGVPAKAEAAWKSAVKADPAAPEAHYRLGRLEMDRGLPGAALAQLRLVSPKLPANAANPPWLADFYFQLGYAERAKGARPASTVALRKYLTVAPADAPSRHEVEQLLGNPGP